MKKLIAIIGVFASTFASADNYSEITRDYESLIELRERANQIEALATLSIYKMELSEPKIFESRVFAGPNTYVWYMWLEYDRSSAANKSQIVKQLKEITK